MSPLVAKIPSDMNDGSKGQHVRRVHAAAITLPRRSQTKSTLGGRPSLQVMKIPTGLNIGGPERRTRHEVPDMRRLNRVTTGLFLLAYLLTLVEPAESNTERFTIAFLSSASLALGIFGFPWIERRGVWAGASYLFVQLTLSTFLVILGGVGIGNTLLVLLALAQSSRILPLWLTLIFCSHLLVAHLGMDRWQDVAREGIGLFVAGVGVVLITRVAVNERFLRAQKEALADELGEANRQLQSYARQAEELAATRERNRLARRDS